LPRIGLISDTHGFLDPQVVDHFAGVQHILHAGDIGWPKIILELEGIAPVTAVTGNTDHGLPYRETEVLQVAAQTLLIHHIVNPRRLEERLERRIAQAGAEVVVFGHTHEPFCEVVNRVLFVNPGSAGRARFGKPRTLAILHWSEGAADFEVDFAELPP